jgi:hypothetical protein
MCNKKTAPGGHTGGVRGYNPPELCYSPAYFVLWCFGYGLHVKVVSIYLQVILHYFSLFVLETKVLLSMKQVSL